MSQVSTNQMHGNINTSIKNMSSSSLSFGYQQQTM
jgi:hypothetical protein